MNPCKKLSDATLTSSSPRDRSLTTMYADEQNWEDDYVLDEPKPESPRRALVAPLPSSGDVSMEVDHDLEEGREYEEGDDLEEDVEMGDGALDLYAKEADKGALRSLIYD